MNTVTLSRPNKPASPSSMMGAPETRRLMRWRYYEAQEGRCYLCGGDMILISDDPTHPDYATFDHVVPRFKKGINGQMNYLLAHKHCNERKGHRHPLPEWEAFARIVFMRVRAMIRLTQNGMSTKLNGTRG